MIIDNIKLMNGLTSSMQRFMKIRILEPTSKDWYSFKKIRKATYKITKTEIKGSTKFITLDIGDLQQEGIQGVAFIRGIPKDVQKYDVGDVIDNHDFRSQAIRIEFNSLPILDSDSPQNIAQKAMKNYGTTIQKFLEREYREVLPEIRIIPKRTENELSKTDYFLKFKKEDSFVKFKELDFSSLTLRLVGRLSPGTYTREQLISYLKGGKIECVILKEPFTGIEISEILFFMKGTLAHYTPFESMIKPNKIQKKYESQQYLLQGAITALMQIFRQTLQEIPHLLLLGEDKFLSLKDRGGMIKYAVAVLGRYENLDIERISELTIFLLDSFIEFSNSKSRTRFENWKQEITAFAPLTDFIIKQLTL